MKQVVTFGEIMMRLSPPLNYRFAQATGLEITYGGGDANVGAALAGLGVPAAHVTCFPDNDLGRAAARQFRALGVNMDATVYEGDRLGLYFLGSRGGGCARAKWCTTAPTRPSPTSTPRSSTGMKS